MKTMISIVRPLLAGILVAATLLCGQSQAAAAAAPLSRASNAFAIDFYKHAGAQPGNLLFSSYSISAALAMTYAGASGDTAVQMQKTMHWTEPAPRVASNFAAMDQLLNDAQKTDAIQLSIANALWPQKGYGFRKDYLDLLGNTFKTSLHEADFAAQPEAERARINQWVEQQTKDRIKDLMPPGSIDPLTRLVLANAIYFKAKWQEPFQATATHPAPFYLAPGDSVGARLMKKTGSFDFVAMPTFKVLAMPYQGGELSMVIVLPDEADGLPQLEKELSNAKLDEWLGFLRTKEVSVFLPKFKITFQLNLNETLSALGMPDAFDAHKADFTNMTGNRDLWISAVMHKAFVEVNEEGTEAAAATGTIMVTKSMAAKRVEIPVFRADHPFLYMIRHNATGMILFFGRLSDPSKA